MATRLNRELNQLYRGLDAYVSFYVWARAKLLDLDYYAQFLPHTGVLVDVGCGRGVVFRESTSVH